MNGDEVSIAALRGVAPISLESWRRLDWLGISTLGELREDAGRRFSDREPSLLRWIEEDAARQVWEFLGDDGARVRTYINLRSQASDPVPAHLARLAAYLRKDLLTLMNESRMPAGELLDHLRAVAALLLRSLKGDQISVRDELQILLRPYAERNREFVSTYYRLDSSKSATLEALGFKGGVTRERVRQIVTKFKRHWSPLRPPMPISETAVELLAAINKPMVLDDWYESLPVEIRNQGTDQLWALQTLSRWGWYPGQSWYRSGKLVLVASGRDREKELKTRRASIFSAIQRERNSGTANIHNLSDEIGEAESTAVRLLSQTGDWIRISDTHFALADTRYTLVGREARYMVSLLGPLSVEKLRQGLARSKVGNPRSFLRLPPRALLPEVLRRAGLTLSDDAVVYPPEPREQVSLAEGHSTVLHYLTAGPPVSTVHEIVKHARDTGLSEVSAKLYLGRSPYIERVAHGLYARRGRPISVLDVEAARTRLEGQNESWLVNQRFELDGSIAVVYEPTPESEMRQFYVRGGMIPTGDWKDAHTGGLVRVRESYFTSSRVREIVRVAIAAQIPFVTVRFQVAKRLVSVALTFEAPDAD